MLSQSKNRNLQKQGREEKDRLRVWELFSFRLVELLSRCELSYLFILKLMEYSKIQENVLVNKCQETLIMYLDSCILIFSNSFILF